MTYIEPPVIEQLKEISLLDYLEQNEPDNLVKLSHSTYCTKEHDSLKLSNGKWFWWSRGFGGKNALSYLTLVKGLSFLEAIEHLDGSSVHSLPTPVTTQYKVKQPTKTLCLPASNRRGNATARDYLIKRSIDPEIIDSCIEKGLIYEALCNGHTNVVFVGKDAHGTVRYGAIRGCGSDFKGEVTGSDKHFAFRLMAKTPDVAVHVTESAIDALSYATLVLENNGDWREKNLLSLGSVSPAPTNIECAKLPRALVQYLADNPHTRHVILHLDRDAAGIAAGDAIAAALSKRFDVTISPPPTGKDVNDFLCAQRKAKARIQDKAKVR